MMCDIFICGKMVYIYKCLCVCVCIYTYIYIYHIYYHDVSNFKNGVPHILVDRPCVFRRLGCFNTHTPASLHLCISISSALFTFHLHLDFVFRFSRNKKTFSAAGYASLNLTHLSHAQEKCHAYSWARDLNTKNWFMRL